MFFLNKLSPQKDSKNVQKNFFKILFILQKFCTREQTKSWKPILKDISLYSVIFLSLNVNSIIASYGNQFNHCFIWQSIPLYKVFQYKHDQYLNKEILTSFISLPCLDKSNQNYVKISKVLDAADQNNHFTCSIFII